MFEIIPKKNDDWSITAEVSYTKAQADKTLCSLCGKRLRSVYPTVLRPVIRQLLIERAIGSVFGAEITVLRNDLYVLLKPFMRGFVFCPLVRIDGSEIQTHIGCYEQHPVRDRGDAESQYFGRCPVCREPVYRPMGHPDLYVMRDDVQGRDVVQTIVKELIVSETVAKQIDWKKFKKNELLKREIRTESLDGLPARYEDWPDEPIDPSLQRFGPD